MNANTLDAAPQTAYDEAPLPSRLTGAVLLPYALLALTLAAMHFDAPARLAALTRSRGAAPTTSVDYPLPSHRS